MVHAFADGPVNQPTPTCASRLETTRRAAVLGAPLRRRKQAAAGPWTGRGSGLAAVGLTAQARPVRAA